MELKDFVSRTITDVIEGVREAQTRAATHSETWVVPPPSRRTTNRVTMLKFDVGLTATDTGGKQGGINVAGVISVGGQTAKESSSVSRIQFEIPVELPWQGSDVPPP